MGTHVHSHLLIRPSRPGLGFGLFAARRIEKGSFVIEYTGRRVASAYADTLPTRYLFELDEAWTIDGSSRSNRARYINHACTPNAEGLILDGRILVHAVRDISEGEEITIDYGDEYFEEFIRPKGCKCEHCSSIVARGL